jgi:glycosyltransferase involved in cell wall biosynthesis
VNILVLTSNPGHASFRQRIEAYLDILRDNGIKCDIARFPSGCLSRWKLFRKSTEYDAVFLQKKCLNPLDSFWLRRYADRVIYDFDDAVIYSDKNPDKTSRKRQTSFRRTVKLSDMVIAGNSYLADLARVSNQNVKVLATGLDVSSYRQDIARPSDGKVRLVWIGSKSTLGYLAEIKPVLEEIGARCNNVVLRIICDSFFDLHNMNVEKHRWAVETQVQDLMAGDIGLAPLPDNRFTNGKCGFKILQYAAAGLPVIASPVGVNVEYVRQGENGFLAANHSQWFEKILLLQQHPLLRKKMGLAGKSCVERFDLKILGKELVSLIKSCPKTWRKS